MPPIHDRTCNQCKRDFEYFIFHIGEVPVCPHCGSKDSETKPPKNTGITYIGTGWHKTDYGKRGRK